MSLQETISSFRKYIDKLEALQRACVLFHWDMSTGAPKKAMNERAKWIGTLQTEAFKMSISNEMCDYLNTLTENIQALDEVTAGIVKEYKKEYDKVKKIPEDEYEAYAILCSKAETVWAEAKEKADFSLFQPSLEAIVEFQKKYIGYNGYVGHPYNTLLNDYEPGMTVEKLDAFFGRLREEIVPLLKKIVESNREIRDDFLYRSFDVAQQEKLSLDILNDIGFDLTRGMMKESEHPFTTGFSINDIRLTTHFYENLFSSALFSTIHEGGHGIYEQSIANNLNDTILCSGTSMGIHESQSRFYENVVGRSYAFLAYYYPKLKEYFSEELKDISLDEFYHAMNIAKPSLIRTEADELTYSLHIMIRYEIEKRLMNNEVTVADLPRLWNTLYKEYLGVEPSNDKEGVLQDVHWAGGMFGYFPSYALGNAYAAQFVNTMQKSFDLEETIKQGDFITIKNWLNENIHQFGKLKSPNEIIEDVTGEPLNAQYLVDYLKDKYTKLYRL